MTAHAPWLRDGVCQACGGINDGHSDDCWAHATYLYGRLPSVERSDELTAWWIELARDESTKVVPKAVEYGATDLVEIGRHLHEAGVIVSREVVERGLDSVRAELGVYFYVVGKMARWADAVATGRDVSDDTLHDIGVYIRMAQRIREVGSWPGVNEEKK